MTGAGEQPVDGAGPTPDQVGTAETIAAIASPSGLARAAVLRLSGPRTGDALRAIGVDDPASPPEGAPGAACRVVLNLPSNAIGKDAALPVRATLLRWFAPRSYTGEDSAEVIIPGNPALADRVLGALLTGPVRPASPGEFTARAFLNGRLTLDQAEGVAATIAAHNADDLRAARRLLDGHLGDRVRVWADELTALLALVEAGIDFTDQEDVVAIAPADLCARIDALRDAIRAQAGGSLGDSAGATEARVVLGGVPNAGKSALFNALLGRRRVVVSEHAGATRDAIDEPLDLPIDASGPGGVRRVRLVDLPGVIGPGDPDQHPDARSPAGLAGVERARSVLRDADVILHCDPSGNFEPLPDADPSASVVRVRTKADLPASTPVAGESVTVSVLDGRGLPGLRAAIARACNARSGDATLVPDRHRRVFAAADDWLARAREHTDSGGDELIAEALRAALSELGLLVGRVHADDVIGRVFATFCVGK